MSTKKIKVDTETFKKVQQSIITEQHKELRKNLSVEQAKKLEETDQIITKVETNLIDNENSNLHIIKNLSVDLKDVLPLNKLYEGTKFKTLNEFQFNNAVMLRFTNKVLVYLMGKNADTVQAESPLYFRALRDTASSIVLNLMYDVIITDSDGNSFNSPIGRKPKMINFNFKKIWKHVQKPKNVKDMTAKDYFNSKFNKLGKDTDYISFELFNDISKFVLMHVEQSEADVPLLKKLNAVNDFVEAGNNFLPVTQQTETVEAIKDCIYNLLDVAVNSNKMDILLDTLINLTDEKTFKEFKEHIKSFETKSAKIKMYQAVKFENNKAKYIQATTSEALKNQLKTA